MSAKRKNLSILFGTKDKGGFNAVSPIVPELRDRGHTAHVVAEGLSAALWEQQGEALAFRGSVNFEEEPFECDIPSILEKIAPNIVVVTAGAPINLEARIAEVARIGGIPVIVVEDIIGSARRLNGVHDVILTLNELAVNFYESRCVLPGVPKVAIGSGYFERIEFSADDAREIERLRGQHELLIQYAGQGGAYTEEIAKMIAGSISLTIPNAHIGLIVRHHPKGPDETTKTAINALFETLTASGRVTVVQTKLTSSQAAALCDLTYTSFGSALSVAAVHGRIPVSVMTPGCAEALMRETGFPVTPLAAVGAAVPCVEPTSIDTLLAQRESLATAQQLYAQPQPLDVEAAADTIEWTATGLELR